MGRPEGGRRTGGDVLSPLVPTRHRMSQKRGRDHFGRLWPLTIVVAATSLLVVAAALFLAEALGEEASHLYCDTDGSHLNCDVYELTGSRLAGLLTFVGVFLLVATASICLFASKMIRAVPESSRWGGFLLGASLLTAVLAIDDYLGIHELPGEVLLAAVDIQPERVVQNAFEVAIIGIWGLLLAFLFWRYRSTIASSEWTLLTIAAALLLASLALDIAPHSWLATAFGVGLDVQSLVEDGLKLVGIAFYATYFVRASAQAMRTFAA
jgi:hypothetical protein